MYADAHWGDTPGRYDADVPLGIDERAKGRRDIGRGRAGHRRHPQQPRRRGAILSLPVLVFALGLAPHDAASASLVIVGITSAIALVEHARAGRVHWRDGLVFGSSARWARSSATLARRVDGHTRCSSRLRRPAPRRRRRPLAARLTACAPEVRRRRRQPGRVDRSAPGRQGLLTRVLRVGAASPSCPPSSSPWASRCAGGRHLTARAHPHTAGALVARAFGDGLCPRLVGHRALHRRDRPRQLRPAPARARPTGSSSAPSRSSSSASASTPAWQSRSPEIGDHGPPCATSTTSPDIPASTTSAARRNRVPATPTGPAPHPASWPSPTTSARRPCGLPDARPAAPPSRERSRSC